MRQRLSVYARSNRLKLVDIRRRGIRKLKKLAGYESAPVARTPRPIIELEQFDAVLDQLGIQSGDRVIVHSGISHIGKFKGGPAKLVERLRERIGPGGVVLFPAFPFGTLMFDYLETGPSFDAASSPAEMGALVDIALGYPDRQRSVHPTHSVCGFGDDVAELLKDHHRDSTPFGPNSPFWRLADTGGKILVIGVGLSSVTGFHLSEDRMGPEFPVRVYRDKIYEVACRSDAGEQITVRTPAHDPMISRVRDCYLVEDAFLREGVYRKIEIGNHYMGVIDFAAMDALLQRLARDERLTIYGKLWG